MALLFDLEALSARDTDEVLRVIFCKAHGHEDGEGIWEPHDNPFLARLVEMFTQRGLTRIDGVRRELEDWLQGRRHVAGEARPRPMTDRVVWTAQEQGVVRLYLESLPPGEWTLDDHMLLIDALQQRYLSPDDMRTEAEWLSTRATIMGRVQASMERVSAKDADKLLAAMPADAEAALARWDWSLLQERVMQFSANRSAEAATRVSEGMRLALRQTIAHEVEQAALAGRPVWSSELQSKLLEEYAIQNRDWRRVAITEAGEALNQGLVASLVPGSRVKRVEQYKGVCAYCAKIDGQVATVVDPAAPDKDGETQIWAGKNNVGRSAAPRRRVGNLLVERTPDELYWLPAGLAHPLCRGRWVVLNQPEEGDDPDFAAWMEKTLHG